jgi:hypothetical protein
VAISLLDQETQIRRSYPVSLYGDAVAPSEANFETNPTSLLDDLNNIRSQLHNLLKNQAGNWWDDLNVPSALDTGAQRGVNDLNTDLHALERKRVLVKAISLADVTVTASQNWEVLAAGELPPNTTAAVGAVTTAGTVVVTHGGTFDTHSLDEIAGATAISPKNLVEVVDGSTRDPILDSSGRRIWGLIQGESGLIDGDTITDTTDNRVQVSFVVVTSTGDDLEACAVGDIQGKTVNLAFTERKALEDLNEVDFLRGAILDVPSGTTVTRQVGYDNQGTTPVDLTTNATLDLEGAGLVWSIRDDLEATLFSITEGSAGGTSEIAFGADVDTFNNDAAVNDFLNGASFDTGAAGTTINVGVTANQIDSGGTLKIASGGGADLNLVAALELNLTDSYRAGSTWSLTDGIALANSSQEWSDFETAFGEVSLLDAIVQAKNTTGRRKVYSVATSDVAADTDVSGPSNDNNLDTDLGDLSAGTFTTDYDIYLNGAHQVNGADAAANKDVYPGTALANGQLKFEKKIKTGDVIILVDWVA